MLSCFVLLQHVISLSQQLQYYKEYQVKLAKVAGSKQAASIVKDALYIVSAGSSDYIQNYYVNPFLNKAYTPDQYSSYLVGIFTSFIKVNKRALIPFPRLKDKLLIRFVTWNRICMA